MITWDNQYLLVTGQVKKLSYHVQHMAAKCRKTITIDIRDSRFRQIDGKIRQSA